MVIFTHSEGGFLIFNGVSSPKLYNETLTRKGWADRKSIALPSETPLPIREDINK